MRKAHSSRRPAPWQLSLVRKPVDLQEIKESSEMKPPRTIFGGESEFRFCPYFHLGFFPLNCLMISILLFAFRGSPNIEMDEHTFMVNRERAVDYLNSLDKVTFYFNIYISFSFFPLEMKLKWKVEIDSNIYHEQ